MMVKCISDKYQTDNGSFLINIEIGKIYETSDTAKYNGNMYLIPNLSRLVPKELFIEVSVARNEKLKILLDE